MAKHQSNSFEFKEKAGGNHLGVRDHAELTRYISQALKE
jgi:hypothetical protein